MGPHQSPEDRRHSTTVILCLIVTGSLILASRSMIQNRCYNGEYSKDWELDSRVKVWSMTIRHFLLQIPAVTFRFGIEKLY